MIKRIASLALCFALLLTGCGGRSQLQSENLMEGVTARQRNETAGVPEESGTAAADFAVKLLQSAAPEGENALFSPLSALCALAMAANGAAGETLTQMETVLGLPVEELNRDLHAWVGNLPSDEKCAFHLANAIWFTDDDRFTVNRDFLQANADWYGAGVYRAPFDRETCGEINAWVKDHTDGMIQDILDEIPASAVMYLVNALAFEGEWAEIYYDYQVREGRFTTESGQSRTVELMYSEESRYLEDENAAGFLKPYAGGAYAFAALLPEEGVTVEEYAASLTGEKLAAILEGARDVAVNAAIPKFESEYSGELSELLAAMGMPDAFDASAADFSGLGRSTAGSIFISRVLHKTYIAVDERGTKAGAATVVEAADGCDLALPQEIKTVVLDRPFLYLLIDCETNRPIFIGTAMDIGE